jgi:hypothetical protein
MRGSECRSISGDKKMLKSLSAALAAGALAIVGFAGVAQAQMKCPPPGTSIKGCYLTPTTPQLPPRK